VTVTPFDVHAYYRQITDVDIGELARELLAGRITQESPQTLFCDCPNHRSQSHRSLHIWLDKQGWFCHACGVGGDVLQLVEFVQHGVVTRGQCGRMPGRTARREISWPRESACRRCRRSRPGVQRKPRKRTSSRFVYVRR